jgi:ArsR family transcriptional regulator, cadmium/lead-responsive transcriptional repressor
MNATAEAPFRFPERPLESDIVAKYFRGLGDPTRMRILEALGTGERSVGELVELLVEPQPKVSNHLACLRWCGFVDSRREHRSVYYRVADKRVLQMIELARGLLLDNAEHVAACRTIDAERC